MVTFTCHVIDTATYRYMCSRAIPSAIVHMAPYIRNCCYFVNLLQIARHAEKMNSLGADAIVMVGDLVDDQVEDIGAIVDPVADFSAPDGQYFAQGEATLFSLDRQSPKYRRKLTCMMFFLTPYTVGSIYIGQQAGSSTQYYIFTIARSSCCRNRLLFSESVSGDPLLLACLTHAFDSCM